MKIRLLTFALTIGCLVALAGRAPAGNVDAPDLKPFGEEISRLLQNHYPKAEITFKDQTIHFEFNTRTFMIHIKNMEGEWQDAHPMIGPKRGGIYGSIELRQGKYEGQAAVPQTFDRVYFKELGMAPYSQKLDHYLYVGLRYPPDVPEEFVTEFERLINGFESYVPQEAR